MTDSELAVVIAAALRGWARHEPALRELDAALGDGDLGITVRSGGLAAADAVEANAAGGLGAALRAAGQAFATANPSTFAALVGGGVLAGARALPERAERTSEDALAFGRAVAQRIQERGKAEPGDKTLLDALLPSLVVLESADGAASRITRSMAAVAHRGVEESTGWESRRGRAGWLGERSIGKPDAGATAYALLLDELAVQFEARP
ncbi:MAG: DAK2 domain-containing protein [Propionicimonas sp.]